MIILIYFFSFSYSTFSFPNIATAWRALMWAEIMNIVLKFYISPTMNIFQLFWLGIFFWKNLYNSIKIKIEVFSNFLFHFCPNWVEFLHIFKNNNYWVWVIYLAGTNPSIIYQINLTCKRYKNSPENIVHFTS